ncbi:MAG: relaxase/mobilization nuclease domain-containing protein [Cyclobacteriaceae bacterium]
MVSKVSRGHSVSGALHYNEKKVQQGQARIIGTANLPQWLSSDAERAQFFAFRVQRAEHLRVQAVHMSVNFAASDRVTEAQMRHIAHRLMRAMKLEAQPYVLYRHSDAGHDHFHVVSTPITARGTRIDLSNNLYRIREETQKIEQQYDLQRTGKNRRSQTLSTPPTVADLTPVQYPDSQLRKSISTVVYHIIGQKNFASLEQLNEQLKTYQVRAVRICNPQGEQKGIMFTALQKDRAIGAPIRSSDLLYQAPGLVKRVDEIIRQQQAIGQGKGLRNEEKLVPPLSNREIAHQRAFKQADHLAKAHSLNQKKGRGIS